MKNIKPVNNGRLIIAGAGSYDHIFSSPNNTHLEGMEETTLKIVGWQGDMFKGTNVSKVANLVSLFHYYFDFCGDHPDVREKLAEQYANMQVVAAPV